MAYTKIHAIKATVDKAIDYICNPDKTDEQIYVSSYACAPETAAIDFKYTLDHCRENSPNKAYHLIQAFAPGEVSYEEAHRIGKELADKVLEGKYSYVLTTHIDKGHIHNHIIFCAADNIEHNKYHDCKQSYYHIRKLSDELCKAHNLSIIIPGGERGKKYKEWQSDQNGSTWKTQLRRDINFCIKSASTYEDFLLLMRAKGYEIKGESFEEGAAKYISFRPLDKERFVRGSTKSLGKEYTKERIRERIDKFFNRMVPNSTNGFCAIPHFFADLRQRLTIKEGPPNNLGLPRLQKGHIVLQTVDILLQRHEAADQIVCQCGICLIRRALKVHGDVKRLVGHAAGRPTLAIPLGEIHGLDHFIRRHSGWMLQLIAKLFDLALGGAVVLQQRKDLILCIVVHIHVHIQILQIISDRYLRKHSEPHHKRRPSAPKKRKSATRQRLMPCLARGNFYNSGLF